MNWSEPIDSGSTENARLENRKLFKILFELLYLRFPPLQTRTCVFRTCIFHPCIFVLTYSILAYSIPRYFRFPYLRFQSPHTNTFNLGIKQYAYLWQCWWKEIKLSDDIVLVGFCQQCSSIKNFCLNVYFMFTCFVEINSKLKKLMNP